MAEPQASEWRTVPEIVVSCALHRPDVVVLADSGGNEVTGVQLACQVRQGAHALSARGVRHGQFVGIDTPSMSWQQVAVAYFSVVWLGAVAVLIMDERSAAVAVEKVGAVLLVSADDRQPAGASGISMAELTSARGLAGPPSAGAGDLLDLVFTSGTTGDPKPVASRHAQWTGLVRPEIMTSRARRVVAHTGIPVGVSGGLHGVLLSHLARGVTSLCGRTTTDLLAGCRRYGADELHLTPHSARALARAMEPGELWAARVATIRVIGGPVPHAVAGQLSRRFPRARVVSLYGLTEGGAAMCVKLVGQENQDSIGRPVEGTKVRVLDPEGQELPPGQIGELAVSSAGKGALSYYDEESLNRAWFADGWARTGDMGYVTPGGEIRLVGRDRELIVLRGGRIRPESVEEILARRLPADVDIAVVGLASANGWDQIAVFLAGGEHNPEVSRARQHLEAMKGPFRPHYVRVLPAIPRGPFGKPLRRVLAQQLSEES
jgi:acyl-coenzyme A synthetase/AMP-(fatty) acid ligase